MRKLLPVEFARNLEHDVAMPHVGGGALEHDDSVTGGEQCLGGTEAVLYRMHPRRHLTPDDDRTGLP